MNESKIELTHRLQSEGRWAEASKFKDDRIADHRSQGTSRKDSQRAAWEEMEQKFPLIAQPEEPLSSGDAPEDWSEDAEVDFGSDAKWVYSKLACANVSPKDAPSAGAWSLFHWAKRHQDRFYEQTMPKALAAKKKRDEEELDDPYADNLDDVEKMFQSLMVEREVQLIASSSKVIKQRVKELVSEWQRCFKVSIPDEALESWRRRMIHVVDDIAQTAAKNPAAFLHE